MHWIRLLLAAATLVLLQTPLAAQPSPPAFGDAIFDSPPKDETGPLEKKAIPFGATEAEPATEPASDNSAPGQAPSPERVKDYVDGLLNGLIAAGELPGASIVIIQNGAVTHKAGYGFADVQARIPVDADKTRFRVASVSKLLTATAVMQMVEQGKADLNADVNTYLPAFKIESNFPEPVTLANLLTHTAGFDDRYLGMAAPLSAPATPLAQHLTQAMPPRVLKPNQIISYSNYGIALAGYVVESLSGKDFNTYVTENVMSPLGMTSSSFGIPYPVPKDMAVPYFKGGKENGYRRSTFDRPLIGPAGDLVTTAGDMANFMLAHLNKGTYGDGAQILSPAIAEQMHAEHFANADGLDGWAFGFATGTRNGIGWIGHDGSWRGFCAQLVLHPESKSGFFVAYNVDCHFAASAPLRKALFDLLWPSEQKVTAQPSANAVQLAKSAEGTYMSVRRARADFTALAAAASQLKVTATGGGELRVVFTATGREFEFLPQQNGTWKNPEYQWNAAFKRASAGGNSVFMIDAQAYDRVSTLGAWSFWTVALALAAGIAVITMWGWASGFLSRHLFGEPQPIITFAPRVTAFIAAGLVLASMLSMLALLSDGAPLAVLHGPSPILMVLLFVPVIIGILVIPMIVWSITGFGAGPRARLAQASYILLTLAVLTFLAFCVEWGFHPIGVLAN